MNRPLAALAFLFGSAFLLPAQNQGLALQNGTTGHVDVPYAPSLVPTGGVTAEAWLTYDGSTLGTGWRFPTALRMDPSPNQASYFLRIEAGQTRANRLLWWVSTTNGNYSIGWNFAAGALTAWTHVAGTYDGATLRLFVDGVQVAQGAGSGPIVNRGGVLRIGNGDLSVTGGETWNGQIDEVRIWPFARPAAAIAATRQMALSAMPGEVSSWPLDGDGLDTSGTNHGAAVGTAAFAGNSLALQAVPFPGALGYGAASGCRTDGLAAINAVATVGNSGFEFVATRAPSSGAGLSLLSFAGLAAPQTLFGLDLLVDLNLGITQFVQSSGLGTCHVPLAIPANPAFTGFSFHAQFVWIDPTCPTGLSASNAIVAIVQP